VKKSFDKTCVDDECLVANRLGSVRRQLDMGVENRRAKMIQELIQTIEATVSRNLFSYTIYNLGVSLRLVPR
jgi:hypothetical protein